MPASRCGSGAAVVRWWYVGGTVAVVRWRWYVGGMFVVRWCMVCGAFSVTCSTRENRGPSRSGGIRRDPDQEGSRAHRAFKWCLQVHNETVAQLQVARLFTFMPAAASYFP